jgi:hypothetical protein
MQPNMTSPPPTDKSMRVSGVALGCLGRESTCHLPPLGATS